MKSAIVTGASKGIGATVAQHLASKGYHLLLIAKQLHQLSQTITNTHKEVCVEILVCDVIEKQKLQQGIEKFHKKTGSIDLLINNAGYVKRGTSELDSAELLTMLNTSLIGAIHVIQLVLPFMKKQNTGYIMNVASRNAKTPRAFLGGYASTKAGLLAYSHSLYKELADTKIKVTALCPGFVDTEMTSTVTNNRELLIQLEDICVTVDFLLRLSESVAIKEIDFESIMQIGGYC